MLCSKRMPPQKGANKENPNPNNHNKKKDESQLKLNQCPECGLLLKNGKGLKIHHTSKHRRKQNASTSPVFWPCNSDTQCDHAKKDSFLQPSPAQIPAENIKLNSHSHANQKTFVTSYTANTVTNNTLEKPKENST